MSTRFGSIERRWLVRYYRAVIDRVITELEPSMTEEQRELWRRILNEETAILREHIVEEPE